MANALQDKMWFLNHDLLQGRYATLDFGCADGTLTREIAARTRLGDRTIGYDSDPSQIALCREDDRGLISYQSQWLNAADVWQHYHGFQGPRLLVLSSVLHEILSQSKGEPHRILREAINMADYVVIRDMYWPDDRYNWVGRGSSLVAKIHEGIHNVGYKDRLYSHEERYGFVAESRKSFVHFLLKEQYREYWRTELEEDYFALTPRAITDLFGMAFAPLHFETYTLPWFKQWAKSMFNVTVIDHTHLKAIYMRVRS